MLAEQRNQEPKCVLFVLLEVHKDGACDEVHALSVAEWLNLIIVAVVADGVQDLVELELAGLVFLEEFEVRERASDILTDFSNHPLSQALLHRDQVEEVVRVRVLLSQLRQLARVNPEIASLDCRP